MTQLSLSSDVHASQLPGERILWRGRPPQGLILLRPRDCFVLPVSIIWTAAVMAAAVAGLHAPGRFRPEHLWSESMALVMAAIGIYLVIIRFFLDGARRRHTWYAVTSRRVLIRQSWPVQRVLSFTGPELCDMVLDEGFGDIGTIRFIGDNDAMPDLMLGYVPSSWVAPVAPPRFERIKGARRVFELIRANCLREESGVV